MAITSAPLSVLITGASSGIGRELALMYLAQGAQVWVLARSLAKLQSLQREFPQTCMPVPVDLASDDDARRAGAVIASQIKTLDIAILNAGTCEYVDVADLQPEPFDKVMAINWRGTINSLLFCLPLLRNKPGSQLVAISSMASVLPMPRSQAYGASKIALEYLFNSLRVDLAQADIAITIVRPGFVKTPLTERNDFVMPFTLDASTAAAKIIQGIRQRQWLVAFPWQLVWLMNVISWLPLKLQIWLLQKIARQSSHPSQLQ